MITESFVMKFIDIRGARTHNLCNLDLTLPRDKLIVFTGLSGSGKSSLAFDTIYAEGQRRYVESLSTYARQFLSMMEKPDVDHIDGLSPAISIEQKSTSHNPRSTGIVARRRILAGWSLITESFVMKFIDIRGARTHNLCNLDLTLPRDKLIVFTGLSGSGKSSLAFDTIYAEGQRRYVESLSTYARQFLSMMEKPDVDHIDGLSPAISIEQKSTSHNPRSTVGTVTEIYDYLRLLFARAGTPRCPDHDITLEAQTVGQMVDQVLALPEGPRLMLVAPVVADRKGEHVQLMADLQAQGFIRARIDGEIYELDQPPQLDLRKKHDIDAIVDRFRVKEDVRLRLAESFETALRLADGVARIAYMDDGDDSDEQEIIFSDRFACNICGYSLTELEPRLFSFNNPSGACPTCDGLGVKQFFDPDRVVISPNLSLAGGAIRGWDRKTTYYYQMIQSLATHYDFDIETPFSELSRKLQNVVLYGSGQEKINFFYANSRGMQIRKQHRFEGVLPNLERRYHETESSAVREELSKFLNSQACPDCEGTRLNRAARHVFICGRALPEITSLSVGHARNFFESMQLDGWRAAIADKIVKEIGHRLGFLSDVGLNYLSLDRSADTLSGGEAQRIRLASQIGSGLVGVMYILDEPSIGLHQRDNKRLLNTLVHLRDTGNTVIVVEHDEEAILAADHIVDLGPGAGVHGGRIVAAGTAEEIMQEPRSLTGQYLSGKRAIALPDERTPVDPDRLIVIVGATGNNLQGIDASIPLGLMTCITGVSGSGKSTLINDTLYKAVADECRPRPGCGCTWRPHCSGRHSRRNHAGTAFADRPVPVRQARYCASR